MAACTALASNDNDVSTLSATASVRMGISRGSCGSGCIGESNVRCLVQLMCLQRYFEVAVRLEAFTAEAAPFLVGINDLGNTGVALPLGGQAGGEVHQQIGHGCVRRFQGDMYLGCRIRRMLI